MQSPEMIAVVIASDGEFRVILHSFQINLFDLAGLHFFHLSACSDGRKWCARCWLQQNATVAYTAVSISAGLHLSPDRRVIRCLTDRPRRVRSLHLCLLSNSFWSNRHDMRGAYSTPNPFCTSRLSSLGNGGCDS